MGRVRIAYELNGERREAEVAAGRLLIDHLREDLGLTGSKLGCGTGDCGACTVRLDGNVVTSCLVYAAECDGCSLETIEGVRERPAGAALVDAFVARGAVQCGICTPGLVVAASALLEGPEEGGGPAQIKRSLAGNICRCTGYWPIVGAVEDAARALAEGKR
jgi:carbon-monoxide dehydrogenase small subunit